MLQIYMQMTIQYSKPKVIQFYIACKVQDQPCTNLGTNQATKLHSPFKLLCMILVEECPITHNVPVCSVGLLLVDCTFIQFTVL